MESYNKIIQDFEKNLDIIESDKEDILVIAEESIKITKKSLKKIRSVVIDKKFNSNEEEIFFFKQIKPKIYSKLIYYLKLFTIESKRPRSSKKSQIKYFNNHIDKLQIYFNDNLEFYHYYRRGATIFDKQYFTRKNADIRLHPDTFHFMADEQFSTSHDSTVATILAYDMLIVYFKKEIEKLKLSDNPKEMALSSKKSKLFWTGSKTDLIELVYSLYASNSVNSGTADIKSIATLFEKAFNIDLGDYYRNFLAIRIRKKERAQFLKQLKESLIAYMDTEDE